MSAEFPDIACECLSRCEFCADNDAALCDHDWMSRPESDTYECLACGAER